MSTETETTPQAKTAADTLTINEIFYSIQGESTFAGQPCVFVRLTGCDLRCTYCDTEYAFYEGKRRSFDEILAEVARHPCRLVEITGGEPLLQKRVHRLMARLCDLNYTVLIETSGAHDVGAIDPRVHRIMDLKCPASGESGRNRWENLAHLRATDEIKFVIATREDYAWVKEQMRAHHLASVCPLLCSWVHPLTPEQQSPVLNRIPMEHTLISRRELAEQIIADALPVRFQAQLHKIIWPPEQRGV